MFEAFCDLNYYFILFYPLLQENINGEEKLKDCSRYREIQTIGCILKQ